MSWKDKLIIALDVSNADKALGIVDMLGDDVSTYKVGFELFVSSGPSIVERLHEKGKGSFSTLSSMIFPIPSRRPLLQRRVSEYSCSIFMPPAAAR